MKSVDICIATYKRPTLLRKLIISLQNQRIGPDIRINVYIIDNDIDRSAYSVFVEAQEESRFYSIHYHHEPIRNIARARNKALRHSQSSLIFFVDDDEVVQNDWVHQHVAGHRKYPSAAVITGPVSPIFPPGTSDWLKGISLYHRRSHATGERVSNAATNNTSIKREALPYPPLFNEDFGLTGGSDSEFFSRVHKLGNEMVWANETKVTEHLEPSRLSIRWLIKRSFRLGQVRGRLRYRCEVNHKSISAILISLLAMVCFLSISIATAPINRKVALENILKSSRHLGLISSFTKHHYEEYSSN